MRILAPNRMDSFHQELGRHILRLFSIFEPSFMGLIVLRRNEFDLGNYTEKGEVSQSESEGENFYILGWISWPRGYDCQTHPAIKAETSGLSHIGARTHRTDLTGHF
jgi:hypothetical protein